MPSPSGSSGPRATCRSGRCGRHRPRGALPGRVPPVPGSVVTDEEVLLFFKGIGPGETHANRVFGVARTPIDRPEGPYRIHPEPILRTDRGVESPRVFRTGGEWQMFALQYSLPGDAKPRRYGHFRGTGPPALGAGERRGAGDNERPAPARGRGHVPPVDAVRARGPEARLQQPPGRRRLGGTPGCSSSGCGRLWKCRGRGVGGRR